MCECNIPEALLTIPEAAKVLGVSRATVYRLIAQKQIGYVDVAPKGRQPRLRIARQQIDAFIRKRSTPAGKAA